MIPQFNKTSYFVTGLRLLESENADGNPEEKGSYLEGDILFPIDGSQRNGLVSESYRWPNGHVPFQIKGIYSKLNL